MSSQKGPTPQRYRVSSKSPSQKRSETMHWSAGQEFVFLPKGEGLLVVPVPERAQLQGIAKGANTEKYRDRKDRF
jgi:hypothetical protein